MDNQHRKIAANRMADWRELDESALQIIAEQKAIERLLCEHCAELGRIADSPSRKRWLALARTHLEIGMMFAIKAVAAPSLSVGILPDQDGTP